MPGHLIPINRMHVRVKDKVCKDAPEYASQCCGWKQLGLCTTGVFVKGMKTKCAKTCGSCGWTDCTGNFTMQASAVVENGNISRSSQVIGLKESLAEVSDKLLVPISANLLTAPSPILSAAQATTPTTPTLVAPSSVVLISAPSSVVPTAALSSVASTSTPVGGQLWSSKDGTCSSRTNVRKPPEYTIVSNSAQNRNHQEYKQTCASLGRVICNSEDMLAFLVHPDYMYKPKHRAVIVNLDDTLKTAHPQFVPHGADGNNGWISNDDKYHHREGYQGKPPFSLKLEDATGKEDAVFCCDTPPKPRCNVKNRSTFPELNNFAVLAAVDKVFKKHKVIYSLTHGTLLGVIRNQGLSPSCGNYRTHDIDIMIYEDLTGSDVMLQFQNATSPLSLDLLDTQVAVYSNGWPFSDGHPHLDRRMAMRGFYDPQGLEDNLAWHVTVVTFDLCFKKST